MKWEETSEPVDPWISERESGGFTTCYVTDFEELWELAYPSLKNKSAAEKQKCLEYADMINPYIKMNSSKIEIERNGYYCLPDPEKIKLY